MTRQTCLVDALPAPARRGNAGPQADGRHRDVNRTAGGRLTRSPTTTTREGLIAAGLVAPKAEPVQIPAPTTAPAAASPAAAESGLPFFAASAVDFRQSPFPGGPPRGRRPRFPIPGADRPCWRRTYFPPAHVGRRSTSRRKSQVLAAPCLRHGRGGFLHA